MLLASTPVPSNETGPNAWGGQAQHCESAGGDKPRLHHCFSRRCVLYLRVAEDRSDLKPG